MLIDETFVFFARKPIRISRTLSEAPDLRIGTQLGYFYGEQFDALFKAAPFQAVEEVSTIEHNLRLLMNDRIDVFIGDRLPSLYLIKQLGLEDHVHIVQEAGTNAPLTISVSPTYVAFSRKTVDPGYVTAFDEALNAMKLDGSYQRVFERYGVSASDSP